MTRPKAALRERFNNESRWKASTEGDNWVNLGDKRRQTGGRRFSSEFGVLPSFSAFCHRSVHLVACRCCTRVHCLTVSKASRDGCGCLCGQRDAAGFLCIPHATRGRSVAFSRAGGFGSLRTPCVGFRLLCDSLRIFAIAGFNYAACLSVSKNAGFGGKRGFVEF